MNFDHLSDLPEWDDDEFKEDDDEGEEWRPNPTKDACKKLYQQWQQVMIVLNGAFDSMNIEERKAAFLRITGKIIKG